MLFHQSHSVLRVSAQGGYRSESNQQYLEGGQHGESILLLIERGHLSEPIGV